MVVVGVVVVVAAAAVVVVVVGRSRFLSSYSVYVNYVR
jgi:hypothetical protein